MIMLNACTQSSHCQAMLFMHFDFSTEKKINVPNLWVINVSMNGSRITLVQNSSNIKSNFRIPSKPYIS